MKNNPIITGTTLLNIIEACKMTKDHLFLVQKDMYGKIHINSTIDTYSKLSYLQIDSNENDFNFWSFAFDILSNAESIKMIIPIMDYKITDIGISIKDGNQIILNFDKRILINMNALVGKISSRLTDYELKTSELDSDRFMQLMKSLKADDGSKFINIDGHIITLYANMLPINKDDILFISYLHPECNTILFIFNIRKKKAKLDLKIYILYLDIKSNIDNPSNIS